MQGRSWRRLASSTVTVTRPAPKLSGDEPPSTAPPTNSEHDPKRASAAQLSTTVILKANGVFLIRIAADSLAKFAAGRT